MPADAEEVRELRTAARVGARDRPSPASGGPHEHNTVRDPRAARRFCQAIGGNAHLAPRAAEVDQNLLFPHQAIEHLARAGFLGLCVPSAYGGTGADALAFVLTIEELAKACASTAFALVAHAAA